MVPTRRRRAAPHALASTPAVRPPSTIRPLAPAAPVLALALGLLLLPAGARAQRRGEGPDSTSRPLRFEFLGPAAGGRIASVAGVPGDPDTYYAGAASGGVWKTTDGGRTFAAIFDEEPVQAIGALAVAPSAPAIVWAGTGEAWTIRDADVTGDGVYKSVDGGRTWTHMGLENAGRIGRIVVHPWDPDIVYVCALGRTTAPQQERGVYRTTDGGRSWQRVLFVDANTGCSGLAMEPNDPQVLYAGTWQISMRPWAEKSGGAGSGVWMSRDGGTTWKRLADGLPHSPVGKVDVAVARSDANRVYALIETPDQGSVWRSDDAGAHWKVVSWDRTLIGRAGYYVRLAVSPTDADELIVASSSLHRSTDGGETFTTIRGGCGDCHDVWWDSDNPDHFAVTGDGGMGITTSHGRRFTSAALPIAQMYHVAVDDRRPYWVYGNRQDNGTMRGPSDSPELPDNVPALNPRRRFGNLGGGGQSDWQHGLGGCESGFTLPEPGDPDIVWATCYGDEVSRWDAKTRLARSVSPWMHTLDSPPDALKYRCHWTPPLAIDPFDPGTVYYGCQVVFRTTDGGQSWSVISPDLSTKDSSRIVSSGGLIGDNLGQFYGEVVFAIAPSPVRKGLIWAGTNDGQVWYTADAGGHWTNVTAGLEGLPPWGTVRRIEPSPFDSATAYVAVDRHLMDDPTPYIYRTTDLGKTWTRISGGLPADHPLSYVMTVAEDPNRQGLLFAGTGHGFFYSRDDGGHWTALQDGLPAAPVTWIAVAKPAHDVVASTYGRGIYVLRDVTPLEQGDVSAPIAAARLFAPAPALRQARDGKAYVDFALPAAPAAPVKVEVLDAGGTPVRTMPLVAHDGLNRATWDLRYDPPRQVEMRTPAPDNPHVFDEPRFKGKATRPVTHWGIEGPQRTGPIAPPGRYTVRLTTPGGTLTEPLEVVKAPAIAASAEDLAASTAAQLRIRNAIDTVADMANTLEIVRRHILDARSRHRNDTATDSALAALDRQAMDVELRLLSRSSMQSDDKWFVEPYALYLNLVWLNAEVGSGGGDVSGGADHAPTAASLAILSDLERKLGEAKTAYHAFIDTTLPAFNRAMVGKVGPIGTAMR